MLTEITIGCSFHRGARAAGIDLTVKNEAPEPLTLSLFGAGVLCAAGAVRRRRKANKAA
jgi:PEP-CTERM motif